MKRVVLSLLLGGLAAAALAQAPKNVVIIGAHALKPGVDTPVDLYLLNPTSVAGIQARLLYDPNVVEPVAPASGSGETAGGVISGFAVVNYETEAAPVGGMKGIQFAIAGASGASTSGKLISFLFHPKAGAATNASSVFSLDPDPNQFVVSDEASSPITTASVRSGSLVVGNATSWSTLIPAGISGSAAASEGGVWVVGDDGLLRAFTAAGAAQAGFTNTNVGGPVPGRPVIKEGAVFVATGAGQVFRIDPATGTAAAGWPVNISGGAAGFAIRSTPAVANGRVYVTDSNDAIRALDLTTGAAAAGTVVTPISASPAAGAGGLSSPAVVGAGTVGSVWVGGADGSVRQFGPDLTPQKTITTGGAVQSSPFINAAGQGFVGSQDGKVYVFDASTGASLGSYDTTGPVQNSPFGIADGAVVVNSNGGLHVVTVSGTTTAGSNPASLKFSGGAANNQSPIVVGTSVWVGDVAGVLHSATTAGGSVMNIPLTPGSPLSSPAVPAAGTVVITSTDGSVIALPAGG